MTLSEWGAIGELLSGIAVIVTLIYLAVQVRQNTSALRSTATQSAHDQTTALYDLLASDPDLGEIFARGLQAPDALTSAQTARFYALMLSVVFRLQNWYLQSRSNAIDEALLTSWTRVLRQMSGSPGFKRFWQTRRHLLSSDFVAYMENEVILSEPDPDYRPLGVTGEP